MDREYLIEGYKRKDLSHIVNVAENIKVFLREGNTREEAVEKLRKSILTNYRKAREFPKKDSIIVIYPVDIGFEALLISKKDYERCNKDKESRITEDNNTKEFD